MSARPVAPIRIAGLPEHPWLIVRRYVGASDHPGMAAVNNAWRESIAVSELVTVAELGNLYANLTGSDPYRDCVMLERDGRVLG